MSLRTTNTNLAPIQKLFAVLLGAALMRGLQAIGLDLGEDVVNDAAMAGAGLLMGYLIPDPRVVS